MTADEIKMVNGLRLIRERMSYWDSSFVMSLYEKSQHFPQAKLSAKQQAHLHRIHRLNADLVAEAVEQHQKATQAWVDKALADGEKARKDYYGA